MDILDLSLFKLLHNQQGCNFYGPQCTMNTQNTQKMHKHDSLTQNGTDVKNANINLKSSAHSGLNDICFSAIMRLCKVFF